MHIQTDLYSFSYKKGSVPPFCKKCGSDLTHRDGKTKDGKQLRQCKVCGFRFVWTSDLPRRNFFSNVISLATELYGTIGISLRTISKQFKKYFDIKISHECVRKWVLTSKSQNFVDDKVDNCQTWHVDETYIKIKGRGLWLWVVYCKETKQVLAWHISKKRLLKEAKAVLQKAVRAAKGKPERIITDGLYAYPVAIKKVMGWHWTIQREKHTIDSGIGKNAIIERVNKEIKRRIRWFGSFQAEKGAEAFFNLFFYHKNKVNSTELT